MRTGGLIDPDRAAGLFDARDGKLFAERLLAIAHYLAGVEELFAYRTDGGPPEILASSSDLAQVEERARAYQKRFHASDPVAEAWRATPPGQGFMVRVAAEAIALPAYRRLCFDQPHFAEKICFGWCWPDHALVVSFYQRRITPEPNMPQLGALAQLAITGLRRLARPAAPVRDELRGRLAEAYPGLSTRECEVCARTLAGETADGIAADLGLGRSTVLTYRQRTYRKLGFSKANELLAAVMG